MWWIILSSILLILIVFLIVMYFQFLNTFKIKKISKTAINMRNAYLKYMDQITQNKEYVNNLLKEKVFIESFDGLRLKADYIKNSKENKIVVFLHGFKSTYYSDFSSIKYYIDQGYSILAIDQRSHRESEGKYITFGILERRDLLSWINYLNERFGNCVEILLIGVSMGASTIMMASGMGFPSNIKGMICDCGYASPIQEISHCIKKYYHLPPKFFVNIFNIYCKIFGKFNLKEATCYEGLASSNTPILLVHGDKDDFVPYTCSVINFNNCLSENKELVSIDCSVHAASYLERPEEYESKISQFLLTINF